MKGRFQQTTNQRILFRLVQFYIRLDRAVKEEDKNIVDIKILKNELSRVKENIGEDISKYVTNNIFVLPESLSLKFSKFEFEYRGVVFQIGNN